MTRLEARLLPVVVLMLLLALVSVLGLWALQRARDAGTPASALAAANSGAVIEWKLVTTWPKNFPGLGRGAETFANEINAMSGGRMRVRVFGADEIVPAFGVFDAVSQGTAEAGHGAAYYWKGKMPGAVFFTAIPFGMTAQETNGWLHYGGGLELWRELYAPAGLIPFAGGNSGVQMSGWFKREINSVDDLRGLKMRIPGLAGEVFTKAGGTAVSVPGSQIYTSLQTGVIDATEWVGPYNDIALGLHQIADYYYVEGWHEPGAMLEIIVNQQAYEALPEDLQAIVTGAARVANQDMLDEFTARNNAALKSLVNEHGSKLRTFPDEVYDALYAASQEALAELVSSDPMAAKINASYQAFLNDVRAYHAISEQGYLNVRSRLLPAQVQQGVRSK